MTPEALTGQSSTPMIWNALPYVATLLLATAILADGLVLFQVRGRWRSLAAGARVGATAILAVTVLRVAVFGGQLLSPAVMIQPDDLQQAALSLVLAMLIVYLVLAWRLQVDAALAVDLVAVALVLVGTIAMAAGGPPLHCDPPSALIALQWALFLAGAGGLMVAGSAGLTLAFRAGLSRRAPRLEWPSWLDLHVLLRAATAVALVALGSGLTLYLWWSWQTAGVLTGGQAGEGWMASAWLVAGMSMLVRRAGQRWGRWTAGLAFLAATLAILGLLIGLDLHRLLET